MVLTLEPTASGTRLVQRREAPEGISSVSAGSPVPPGWGPAFQAELREGMRATLAGIKGAAEG